MAPPRMFWRYLILTLLLGIPSSHILTSATYERAAGEGGSPQENRDVLIDQIVDELTRQKLAEAASVGVQTEQKVLDGLGQSSKAVGLSKKDDVQKPAEQNFEAAEHAPAGEGSSKDANGDHKEGGEATYAPPGRHEAHRLVDGDDEEESHLLSHSDTRFAVIVGAGLAAGFVGLMMAGICYYKFRKNAKAATDIEYPAYGVTGPMKEKIPSPGDRKLAQSAQMYHYQHQKQQMIAMEKANGDMKHDASDDDSEEDNVEGDYTVYECPGLAPTGEMEVINPLFRGGEENTTASSERPSAPQDPGQGNQ